jgi:hypothetical protein
LRLVLPSGKRSTSLRISFHALQGDSDRTAHGRLTLLSPQGRVISQSDVLGDLQVSERWGSFTTYAFEGRHGRALTVVLDPANPTAPGVKNLYLLQDDAVVYAGTLDE